MTPRTATTWIERLSRNPPPPPPPSVGEEEGVTEGINEEEGGRGIRGECEREGVEDAESTREEEGGVVRMEDEVVVMKREEDTNKIINDINWSRQWTIPVSDDDTNDDDESDDNNDDGISVVDTVVGRTHDDTSDELQ